MNINRTGYLKRSRTKENDYNIIPSGDITTKNMAFPIYANGKLLLPDTGDYKFDTNFVVETPVNKDTMKKPKKKLKMQMGGAADPTSSMMGALTGPYGGMIAAMAGKTIAGDAMLMKPHETYKGLEDPQLNLGEAGQSLMTSGLPGLVKYGINYSKDVKDYEKNLSQTQSMNKVMYEKTHDPYGQYGYMQGNAAKNVYSLAEGGGIFGGPGRNLCGAYHDSGGGPLSGLKKIGKSIFHGKSSIPRAEFRHTTTKTIPVEEKKVAPMTVPMFDDGGNISPEKRNLYTVIANDAGHGSVSLSKQEGGQIPTELNDLFERAMQESGGDEEKAKALVDKHFHNPQMRKKKK
ncbi:Uncharacterised protein [uncultured archaeon]|nr:Uncharacterised protein [uncultured archaeon]